MSNIVYFLVYFIYFIFSLFLAKLEICTIIGDFSRVKVNPINHAHANEDAAARNSNSTLICNKFLRNICLYL